MPTDVHRHLLTPRLSEALAARDAAPCLRRDGSGWSLRVAHEPAARVTRSADGGAELRADGLDRGLVALSAALGVEALADARPLLEAWHADCADLPHGLGAWGSLPLADVVPADVDAALAGGRAGVCVPADAVATPAALDALGPALEALERRGGVLFVHPGPAGAGTWMPALTAYPAALLAAWLAWAAHGRAAHPRLRVLFAALAGLGPLHAERIAARGGPDVAADPLTFFDTSSYGPDAVAGMARAVGEGQLVYGSDRPWAGRPFEHERLPAALSTVNADRLLEAA